MPSKPSPSREMQHPVFTQTMLDALDALRSPVWIFDIQHMRMWWANGAALRIWGASDRQSLLDRDFSDASESTRTRLQSYLLQFEQSDSVVEQWTFYPEGKAISLRCVCSGIRIEDGRLAMLVEGTADVMERIDDDTLRSVEALRHTSVMISLFTLEGKLVMQNPSAIACYGSQKAISNPFLNRFVDTLVREQAMQCLNANRVFSVETQVRTQAGIDWHGLDARLTNDPATGKPMILVNEKDITERRRAEAALQKQIEISAGLRSILDSMGDAVIAVDETFTLIFANSAVAPMLGESFAAIGSQRWVHVQNVYLPDQITLCPPQQLPLFRAAKGDEINSEELFVHLPTWKQGIWVMMTGRSLRDQEGALRGGVIVCRDITEQKQTEVQLRRSAEQLRQQADELQQTLDELRQAQTQLVQSEKMSGLGQLVAGVAHEINNPLNFIHGNLGYISNYVNDLLSLVENYQRYYPTPVEAIQQQLEAIDVAFLMEDLSKILSSMRMGSDRICGIVQSLRNFSRLDESSYKAVDIHQGIDSTLLILQNRLKGHGNHPAIQVIREYGDLPDIECYAGLLNQVFMNLLVNAIDAIEQRVDREGSNIMPTIRISTTTVENQYAVVIIADNGIGMSESVQKRLFDPFFTTKPVGKGTGLGLSISYQIVVERHAGKLKYRSELNRGTEFFIEIPIQL